MAGMPFLAGIALWTRRDKRGESMPTPAQELVLQECAGPTMG